MVVNSKKGLVDKSRGIVSLITVDILNFREPLRLGRHVARMKVVYYESIKGELKTKLLFIMNR